MNCTKEELLLYAVTDRSWLHGRTLKEQVKEAFGELRFMGADNCYRYDKDSKKKTCLLYTSPSPRD